jgi:alkanesulfonate monooxygenase SsuD/methylene tetrahydromethanopterin reductase-like flavin-dependent oxidoreductase (luciferase family)
VVKAFAQAVEDLGYDHIVIYDHVLGAVHADREPKLTGPYKESDPFHEPLVTYAYLAGVTNNLGLATGVIILPQRQTALFAKQAAAVDLFSDGRLRLGVGIGWNWVEYDGVEMSRHFRRRGKRQEQQIALIRKLWEQPVVEHEDSDHRIDRAAILPRAKRHFLSGLEVAARPHMTGRLGLGTGLCSRAGPKPRRFKSRRGSKPGLSNWEGIAKRSASSPSSNTRAGITDGPAISRRGGMLGGATYPS